MQRQSITGRIEKLEEEKASLEEKMLEDTFTLWDAE